MQRSSEGNGLAIAVTGMAVRFPGANSVEELRKNLREGVESVYLGGSSLLAVHMMGRVRREYPVEPSVTTLFEAPPVRSLGGVIRSRRAGPPGPPAGDDHLSHSGARTTHDRRTSDAAGK